MEDKKLLENYEREYAYEISKENVLIEDLVKCGVSKKLFLIDILFERICY